MDFSLPLFPMIIFSVAFILVFVMINLVFRVLMGYKRRFLPNILTSILMCLFIFTGLRNSYKTETGFVILADKVGDPVVSTVFRVEPKGLGQKDSKYCQVGSDNIYTHHNISIFTAAQVGDVLRRYQYTDSYLIFGKTVWQSCRDVYMPVKLVSLYPDLNYWPFIEGDIKKGDPDYDRIFKLTQPQR